MTEKQKYDNYFELIMAVISLEEELKREIIYDELTETLIIDRAKFEEQLNRLKAVVPGVINLKNNFKIDALERLMNEMKGVKSPEVVRRPFTEGEIYILKDKYQKGKELEMAELLNRPVQSIWTKVRDLGIVKNS